MRQVTFPSYSVLMSVYAKERPEWLRAAVESMLSQTVPPSEFVIVEDGPLTDELYKEIARFVAGNPSLFRVVSYPENRGLGYALREGIASCTKPVVARMDSDDLARPKRLETQLFLMEERGLDMVGSQVVEFVESPDRPVAVTDLPEGYDAIVAYSKRRNPFRHPPMTFRREKVLEAGSYSSEFFYFEDWDLFNRMLAIGCRAENIHEPLVAMRVTSDFYARRGGVAYLRHAWRFKRSQVRRGWFTPVDFVASFLPQAAVCLLPNVTRIAIYTKMLRKRNR